MRSLSLFILACGLVFSSAYVVKTVRFGARNLKGHHAFTSERRASVAKDVGTGVFGADLNGNGDIGFTLQPTLGEQDGVEDGLSAAGSGKVTRRKRPSFEKVLKCLILYNELKTGNRAKAISQIHETPDDMVIEKLVKASLRKFKGEAVAEDESVGISMFLLMTPSKNFVIPDDDDRWPADCAGIRLGQVVVDIRRKRSFKRENQKEVLDTLHFPWKPTSARFAHVLEGLAIYKEQYGDRPLKSNFMVPVVSGTKGMLTNEDDDEIDDDATFDPLSEQQDMWKARQRSTSHAITGFQANKDFIFARAKAVEDSPWPVHLMGFHLGKALRLLVEDIRRKYSECSASGPASSSHEGGAAAASAKRATDEVSSVSFAASEGDSSESILEEILEQVRLLQLYGVAVDLDSALAPLSSTLAAGKATTASSEAPAVKKTKAAKSEAFPAPREAGKQAGSDEASKLAAVASPSASSGDTRASEAKEEAAIPAARALAPATPAAATATPEAPVKRKQGRPRRNRSEEEPLNSEPVTLAGAVKLARERDLEMRSRNRAVRAMPPSPPPIQQQYLSGGEGPLHAGDGTDQIGHGATEASLSHDERLARGMAAMRTLDALGLESGADGSPLHSEFDDMDGADGADMDKKKRRRRRLRVSSTHRFDLLLEGLRVYHSIYGDHHVPVQFVVPSADSGSQYIVGAAEGEETWGGKRSLWPPQLHAFALGKELSRTLTSLKELKEIEALEEEEEARGGPGAAACLSPDILERKRGLLEKKEALVALGVPLLKRRDQNFELILSALKTHDDLFGDLLVPRYFVVPSEEPWAKETWGMPLGHKVRNIRYRGAYSSLNNRRRLRDIGFSFEYVKDATPRPSKEKRQEMGQHWYDGAYELWEEPGDE